MIIVNVINNLSYKWFEDLKLEWYAVTAVSSMLLGLGKIEFPAASFYGSTWKLKSLIVIFVILSIQYTFCMKTKNNN